MNETRQCKKCLTVKPLDDNSFDTYIQNGKRGFRYTCLICARRYCADKMRRYRGYPKPHHTPNPAPEDTLIGGVLMRKCDECEVMKPLTSQNFRKFHRAGKMKPGYPAYFNRTCLKCAYSINTKDGRNHYAKQMLDSARHRARRDGVPCTITKEDIAIPENCPVFGYKLEVGDRHNHQKSPTLDKHFPELGYVAGNISVISHEANRIKSNATLEQLKQMVAYMEGLRGKETT